MSFADDALLFGKASREEAVAINEVLHKYTEATGQRINFHKSNINFSSKIPFSLRKDLLTILTMKNWISLINI